MEPTHDATPIPEPVADGASKEAPAPARAEAATSDDPTVGTGSVIALGCIAGTVVLILIGLLFLGILAIF